MKSESEIKEHFEKLAPEVQERLLDELLKEFEMRGSVLENARQELKKSIKNKSCPHCRSESVYKRGKKNGVQMYNCRSCLKWYSETTGTPLWDIKLKHKWQGYLRCMQQGMTLRQISKEMGISIQTSFDWRHKVLSALNSYTPEMLSGVVECDELELALSNKGSRNLERKPRKRGSDFKRNDETEDATVVQVVTAVQRNGEKFFKAVESKRLSAEQLSEVFKDKLAPKTTLVTDGHRSYKKFAKHNGELKHKTIIAKQHVSNEDTNTHLQNVNNTHGQLRKFLLPFNGVSSKYLQNYLNWFAYADKLQGTKTTIKQWLFVILASPQAYELFQLFKQNAVNIRT